MIVPIDTFGSRSFLVGEITGFALVDTGMQASAKPVLNALAGMGLGPEAIKLIIITHAHIDHTGGLARIKSLSKAPVLSHRLEAPFIARGESSETCPRTFIARLLNHLAPEHLPAGTVVDFPIETETDLKDFSLSGQVIPTPGHTAGSISVLCADGIALVGDLVRGKKNRITAGFFYSDLAAIRTSLETLAGKGVTDIESAHGERVPLTQAISALKR